MTATDPAVAEKAAIRWRVVLYGQTIWSGHETSAKILANDINTAIRVHESKQSKE